MKVSAAGPQYGIHSSPSMEMEVVPVRDNINLDAMSLLLSEELQRVLCAFSSRSGIFAPAERHVQ